jgi:hypothetical protein
MSFGKLPRLILLASALSSYGCVVETPTNAPAADANAAAADNRAAEKASPTPAVNPTPTSAPSPAPNAAAADKLESYMNAAAADLAPEEREALARIPEEARRLPALRGYLRAGGDAMSRWAWSRERIESYEKSDEYAAALAEVEKVRREFERLNPGYSLRVNTKVRSLDEQLSKWNEAESVKAAGEELLERARAEVEGPAYAAAAGASDVRRFESFLRGAVTRVTPTVAVPGLSPHGQSRAFDFQVMRGSQLVAGTSASDEAWDKAGWTQKLQDAVRGSSAKFGGPLESPREPWHYDYRP